MSASNVLSLRARAEDDKQDTRIVVPNARIAGKPFQVALNRTYLLRALRFELSEIRIHDSLSPLLFSSPGKTMIIMPVRLDGPVSPSPATPGQPTIVPQNTSPNENASEIPTPSATEAENPTEKKPTMQTTATNIRERGQPRAQNGSDEGEEGRSSFKAALEHLGQIKARLRDILGDLAEVTCLLKSAEKERRATKEIDTVRSKLREIQSVKI